MADTGALQRSLLFAPWCIALFGWILILCGLAALQADCNNSGANAITVAGSAGYFSPQPCSRFYAFSWWIMSFLFVIVVLMPILLGTDTLKRFRGGLMAFVAIETMLLMDMCNSFLYFNSVPTIHGALLSRGRVVVAGSMTSAIALFVALLVLGVRNEQDPTLFEKRVGAPVQDPNTTRGGVYPDVDSRDQQVAYNNPLSEG